ncbi:NAD-binding protein [Hydrogenimonas urashimensis]|uniref:NAD-binding protein n=1 Tax=Hydrogenimonas urashimensis TaxID=2740515 RepID=UPI0019150EDC|nr:NAD-binding protein [Hydrogenimonas urashimensis]
MDIIIAGAGRVGFNLARTLSIGHNVTIIDRNAEALHRLQESLDILPIHGDIEDPHTYRKLIDKEADLFIAVTDTDEANLISTLIADDMIDVKRKVIRLRNAFFDRSSIRDKLGISKTVFPLRITSETVATLLDYPKANNVKSFRHTAFKLISVWATSLNEATVIEREGFDIVGIERGKHFFVPQDGTPVKPHDLVYLFGDEAKIRELCRRFDTETPRSIERCIVFGAGDLGISIAKKLIENGKEVKLIEKDMTLCETAEEKLEGEAMMLSCKYGTQELFEEEGLEYADMMIAATNNDEYNIIKCLEAKEHGIHKVVAVNNEREYYNLMHTLGIVVVRGPKMSAYNAILESLYTSSVVMERKFCGGKAVIFLRKVFKQSHLIGKKVKPPKKKDHIKIYLIREDRLIPFEEAETMEEGDVLVGFTAEEHAPKLKVWFYGL